MTILHQNRPQTPTRGFAFDIKGSCEIGISQNRAWSDCPLQCLKGNLGSRSRLILAVCLFPKELGKRLSNIPIIRNKSMVIPSQPKKTPNSLQDRSIGHWRTASIREGSICTPSAETTWPRKSIEEWAQEHFFELIIKEASAKRWRTWERRLSARHENPNQHCKSEYRWWKLEQTDIVGA